MKKSLVDPRRVNYFAKYLPRDPVKGDGAATGTDPQPMPSVRRNALYDFQNAPKIPRPNLAESFIPVIGPAWEAAGDLQDGDYRGAAFNAGMAVLDALPVGVGVKGLRAASKGIGVWKKGSLTANPARKAYRAKVMAKAGDEAHHAVPLNGISRSAQNWRNHYAFLKPLPKAVHRRLTGRWGELPKYGPAGQIWHGTTDWMKAYPVGAAGYLADSVQNALYPPRDRPPVSRPNYGNKGEPPYRGDDE